MKKTDLIGLSRLIWEWNYAEYKMQNDDRKWMQTFCNGVQIGIEVSVNELYGYDADEFREICSLYYADDTRQYLKRIKLVKTSNK